MSLNVFVIGNDMKKFATSGANVAAALRVAQRLGRGKRVVTLIPDAAERYMSKGIFTKWRKDTPPDPAD